MPVQVSQYLPFVPPLALPLPVPFAAPPVAFANLSLAVVANFGLNLLVAITLEPLQAAVGQAYLFLLYAALCVVSLVFIARVVPETKGKSLEEIEGMLRGR